MSMLPADIHKRLDEEPAAVAIPAGWRLVPEEPTLAMVAAWVQSQRTPGARTIEAGYRAMLAAAPLPALAGGRRNPRHLCPDGEVCPAGIVCPPAACSRIPSAFVRTRGG